MSKTFWYKFDLYAPSFPLRFKKERRYKSKIGFILGVLSILVFIYIFINGILTILEKNSFSIVQETLYANHAKINFSNIPLLLHLQNIQNGDDYTFNSSIFNISLTIKTYEYINNEIVLSNENIPLIKCNTKYFLNKYYDFYDYNLLNEYLCPYYTNENYFNIEGDFSDSSIVKYLSLKISPCNNNDCIDYKEIEDLINNIKLVFYVRINYPVFNNYYYPIKHYFKSFQVSLSTSQSKDIIYNFYQKNFTSDNGLFFSSYLKYSLFDYDSTSSELIIFNNEYFFKAKFLVVKKIIDIKRNYKRVTEMLGEIGGSCNVIFSICNLVTSYLLRHIINEEIINLVIDRNIEIKKDKILKTVNNIKLENLFLTNNTLNNSINRISQKNYIMDSSKSDHLFSKNFLNYQNSNTKKVFYKNEKVKLHWYHNIFPMEFFIKSKEMIKLNRYKDFIFLSISLEKFFEIDEVNSILQKAIIKLNDTVRPLQQKTKSYTLSLNNAIKDNNIIISNIKKNCIEKNKFKTQIKTKININQISQNTKNNNCKRIQFNFNK